MENTRKKRTFFTKKRMISDLRKMRDDLMENQIATFEISKKYPSIYNYKIFENLVSKDYIKITKKEGKKKFYKWNFRRNLNYHIFDFLYNNAIKSREEIIKRQKKQDAISTSEEPIANFDHPFFHFNEGLFKPRNTAMTLAKEIREKNENWQDAIKRASEILSEKKSEENSKLQFEEPILEPIKKVVMKEIEMPLGFQMWSPDEKARYLGLVPTEEEIQAWKDEIEGLKIKLEKKSIELKDLKSEMAWKDNHVYSLINDFENKLAEKEKHYEKLLSEKPLEPTFIPKEEDKKPFTPVLAEIKKQEIENKKPTKYLKLFGYMIYEKN